MGGASAPLPRKGWIALNTDAIEKILDEEVKFYTNKLCETDVYVEYCGRTGAECFEPVKSTMFNSFIGYRYRELTGIKERPDYKELLAIKCEDAIYLQKNQVVINRRVAGSLSKGIVYFLANPLWESVIVKPGEWKVKHSKKTKFLKGVSDLEQVKPVSGRNCLKLLKPYINLKHDDFILLVVCIIQYFCRESSHFALIISSGQGTGKSTLTKLIQRLVSPSLADVVLTPNNESELKNALANTYLACFDNTTSGLKENFSNILCAAITGSKEAKRKLYTNCDQVILSLHNIVILNGIEIVPGKSDLAERSLLMELKRIERKDRIPESKFWESVEMDMPAIMGAIFDTLARAMKVLPTLQVEELDRMADAHLEMLAIAVALGVEQSEFQRILDANHEKLQNAYAQSNDFVNAVLAYLDSHEKVDMPAEEFRCKLRKVCGHIEGFPGSASALSRKLNQEKEAIWLAGYKLDTDKKHRSTNIVIERIPKSQQTKAQKDAISSRAKS